MQGGHWPTPILLPGGDAGRGRAGGARGLFRPLPALSSEDVALRRDDVHVIFTNLNLKKTNDFFKQ